MAVFPAEALAAAVEAVGNPVGQNKKASALSFCEVRARRRFFL